MCDPISIAGMAMSAVGAAGTAKTQSNYVDAVNASNKKAYALSQKAREAERARQDAMEAEGEATFADTSEDLTREKFDEDQGAAAERFTDTLDAQPSALPVNGLLPGQDGASVAVKGAVAKRVNDEATATRERIKNFANLVSFGRAGESRAASLGAAGDDMSTLGGLRRGSLGVANQEQDVRPGEVTPGSNLFADILSGVGGVMGYAGPGLFGGGAGAAAGNVRPKANPFY